MKRLLLLLLVLILFLASCTSGPVFDRRSSFTQVDYFTGKEGLSISFLEQAPPDKVFEGAPLDVQLLVENKGSFDITDDYMASFHLTFDTLEMLRQTTSAQDSIKPVTTQLQIHGKSTAYPEGELYYLFSEDNEQYYDRYGGSVVTFNAKPIVANFEKNQATFYATACYPYKTFFSDDVCIDTDPQNVDVRQKVCEAEDKSYSKGQGAPVAITAIETNMVPRGTYVLPQFVVHIEHYGDGIVSDFIIDTNGACKEITSTAVNTFKIDARLGNDSLACYPEVVRFRDGEAETVCKLETNSIDLVSTNYLSSLVIELSYLYTETISKDLIVERIRPLNLFEETEFTEDFCHSWEVFIPGVDRNKGKCISKCEAYAMQQNTQPFRDVALNDDLNNPQANTWPILQQGVSNQELASAWDTLNCVYGDESLCRQNPSTCILANDFCQPGTFCGWPTCFERNNKPRVEEITATDSFISWSCRDADDTITLDPQQTCGCDTIAYWTFVEKRILQTLVNGEIPGCEDIPDFKYAENEVEGSYDSNYKAMDFQIATPSYNSDETTICLKVVDKQGNAAYQRVNNLNR
ncbi:hypothetical protein K9M74_02150 [Candidatus Woesearchaeota archaeon]|nr:hypothetical protein [Candidatus Woesearchaeota archaeon]